MPNPHIYCLPLLSSRLEGGPGRWEVFDPSNLRKAVERALAH